VIPNRCTKFRRPMRFLETKSPLSVCYGAALNLAFFRYPYVAADPLLNGLHSEPEFGQILKVARQRHEAFKSSFFYAQLRQVSRFFVGRT